MEKIWIKAGLFIDGTGAEPRKNATLLVENGAITAIDGQQPTEDCTVLDYSNYTVMPGMINAHVHIDMSAGPDLSGELRTRSEVDAVLCMLRNMEQYLATGVTYIRSLGSGDCLDVKLRNAVRRGEIKGPDVVAAGANICITGGHGWYFGVECDGVDACVRATRDNLKHGSDCIKFMATGGVMTEGNEPGTMQMEYEEMAAVVREAHKVGARTATHAQGMRGIEAAVRAGVDTVEHAMYLSDEIIAEMLRRGTIMVPTLAAPYRILEMGVEGGIPAYQVEKCQRVCEDHKDSFRKAYQAGVRIAAGTDAGTPYNLHSDTWFEAKLMIDCGMAPMDAIRALTQVAAEALDIDSKYGTLEMGKQADLIAVEGNPVEDIECLQNIVATLKRGTVVFERG